MIYNHKYLDAEAGPRALQRKVMFNVRYYFCRRGSENIHDMTKETFRLAFDKETKIAYLFKAKDEMTKNHQESDNPVITGFMPQLLNVDGTVNKLCPIRSYENYLGHLFEKCPFLWQTPNDGAFQKGNTIWYKNKRVGENTIGQFMTELCKHVPTSKKYTNHCLRVTGTTNLTRCNFTDKQIMSVTGHKSLQSLSLYQRVKNDEKMMMGMSLAYSLINPSEVQIALNDAKNFEVEQPRHEPPQENSMEIVQIDPVATGHNLAPLENAVQPYVDQQVKEDDVNFDLMEIINEVNDEELMLAATQMETEYQTHKSTSKTAVIRKQAGPPEMAASPFAHCRIGSIGTININIYKQ